MPQASDTNIISQMSHHKCHRLLTLHNCVTHQNKITFFSQLCNGIIVAGHAFMYSDAMAGYRVAKRHRMPCFYRSLSTKEPYENWLFRGKRPTSHGILRVFATLHTTVRIQLSRNTFRFICRISRFLYSDSHSSIEYRVAKTHRMP